MSSEIADVVAKRREVALTKPAYEDGGLMAMASLTDTDFAERLAHLKRGNDRIRQIKRELMQEDSHYGNLPGIDKPALLKPGAEVLCSIYSLRPDFVPDVRYGDGAAAPHVSVTMRCELHLGDLTGPVVAVGYGAANSWERKHRYRTAERACPSCGSEGTVRRSGYPNKGGKFEGQKGWWCKACKTNWDDPKESSILEQQTGMVENKDPYDLLNTLVKMAKKRAHVDAALTGTASSDLFTQDVEEDVEEDADHEDRAVKNTESEKKTAPKKGPPREPGEDNAESSDTPPSQTLTCRFCDSPEVKLSKDRKSAECRSCKKGFNIGR